MQKSIFNLLSEPMHVIRYDFKDFLEVLESACSNLWAYERVRTEVSAMLNAEFTPEELTMESMKNLRFSFWENLATYLKNQDNLSIDAESGTNSPRFVLKVSLIDPTKSYTDAARMTVDEYFSSTATIGDVFLIGDDLGMGLIKDVREFWTKKPRAIQRTPQEKLADETPEIKKDPHPLSTAIVALLKVTLGPGTRTRVKRVPRRKPDNTLTIETHLTLPDWNEGVRARMVVFGELSETGTFVVDFVSYGVAGGSFDHEGSDIYDAATIQRAVNDIVDFLTAKPEQQL